MTKFNYNINNFNSHSILPCNLTGSKFGLHFRYSATLSNLIGQKRVFRSGNSVQNTNLAQNPTDQSFGDQFKFTRYAPKSSNHNSKDTNVIIDNLRNKPKNSFLFDTISNLNILSRGTGFINNRDMQEEIEQFTFNQYYDFLYNKPSIVNSIDKSILKSNMAKYIESKDDILTKYIDLLFSNKKLPKSSDGDFIMDILHSVGKTRIKNIALYHYLVIVTYHKSDYYDFISLMNTTISIGKKLISLYLNSIVSAERSLKKEESSFLSYSTIIDEWKSKNESRYSSSKNDTFISMLGAKIIDILESSGMINKIILKHAWNEKHWVLGVGEPDSIKEVLDSKIFVLPPKLPMIVPPKPYGVNKVGGYLLNDINYKEDLFIEKQSYKLSSEITNKDKIYTMVNNISSTEFKVNTELLNYIKTTRGSQLIEDTNVKHKYESQAKRTALQEAAIKSHNSKLLLQEMILEIAELYKNFNKIYFPVRLDQRGRLYCSPAFFNYQSNELSKALILFAKPGIIHRKDEDSVTYLKVYGANCFGGNLTRKSISDKCSWVDKHKNSIINYETDDLVFKAEDKLLFLAFCIEYKAYIKFLNDENLSEFNTHLPVQLDATCNGFQHMAMLSNEEQLYDKLNLKVVKKNKVAIIKDSECLDEPEDFYNFILHKLVQKFKFRLESKEPMENDIRNSYLRLSNFIWDRKYIKKTLMTVPYNASKLSMRRYLLGELYSRGKKNDEDKLEWFSDTKNGKSTINNKDVDILIDEVNDIIFGDYAKIKNLSKYLNNVAKLFNSLNLPITWNLPSGLTIHQSYLQSKSISIAPFAYTKTRINLRVTLKDKYDTHKQIRALMPNLIHSLDAHSLCHLYYYFNKGLKNPQFYSIHDCFGTTCEKVSRLKHILASVYTDLYCNDSYLIKFDKDILSLIRSMTKYDIKGRTVTLDSGVKFQIHDIDWVLAKKTLPLSAIRKIDSQHILI